MENCDGISVMSSSEHCGIDSNTLVSANNAATSSVFGQLTSTVGLNMKQNVGAKRVFVVTKRSQIDAFQVRRVCSADECMDFFINFIHRKINFDSSINKGKIQ